MNENYLILPLNETLEIKTVSITPKRIDECVNMYGQRILENSIVFLVTQMAYHCMKI